MPLILSIETSTTVCSVALTDGKKVIATRKLLEDKSHASHLTILIREVLEESGRAMSDIEAIAISEGPGSYTGLRIGVSTAKGLCYALGVPLIGISTLKAMAYEVQATSKPSALLCPMIDARRMEVYTAVYNSSLDELQAPHPKILNQESFQETLGDASVLFFGNGSGKFKEVVSLSNSEFIEDLSPSAWAVGVLAFQKLENNQVEDLAYFEPVYLKEFQATKPKSLL